MNKISILASPQQLVPDHTDAGRQFEHLCTELVIRLGAGLTDAAQYRLLFRQPGGRNWTTKELTPCDNVITFPLPRALTEEHGPLEVQLRVFEEGESGWKLKYTPIITPSLYIAMSIRSPFDEIPEDVGRDLLEDVTQLVNDATEAAKSAEESAIRAEKAAETAGSGGAGDVDASEVTYDGAHDKDIENVEQALSYLFGEVDGSNAVVAEIKTTLGVE